MILESKIQSNILKYLRTRPNSFTYKHEPVPAGIPDIHHIENGKSYWYEVKRSKSHKPSKIQKRIHKKLKKAGQKVHIVWSLEQVILTLS
jgi:hypothetical protein